jgi:hypothetical protein
MKYFRYFSLFWSKNKIDYYIKKTHLETLNEIQDMLTDKLKYSTRDLLDLSFDENMVTKTLFFQYIKHGVLNFLPSKYVDLLKNVLDDQMYPGYEEEVQELYDFISKLKIEYEVDVLLLREKIKIYRFIG